MKTLSYGEILWDIFSDSRCLGGAPLNVAGHLARLGFEAYIISSVGRDALGEEALEQMSENKVQTCFVRKHPALPTGYTEIKLKGGMPDYEFNLPCAWDSIHLTKEERKIVVGTEWDVFCFGTLAQRAGESRTTLKKLLPDLNAKIVFFDVNFRKAFYSRQILEWSFGFSDIVKMNDEESPIIKRLLGHPEALPDNDFYTRLIDEYTLRGILVTRGKEGVSAFFGGNKFVHSPSPVTVVDTVGAGDSFSAAFLAALLAGKTVAESLSVASDLADYVVSHSGALPEYDKAICTRLQGIMGNISDNICYMHDQ